jgi:hypothetical protein
VAPGDRVTFRAETEALGMYSVSGAKRDLFEDAEARIAVADDAPGEVLVERPIGRPYLHLRR